MRLAGFEGGPLGRRVVRRIEEPSEQVLTIAARPGEAAPVSRNAGSAARVTRAIPTTLTLKTRSHSASSLAAMSPAAPMPALFTSTSNPPRAEIACATAAFTLSSSVTSAATAVCR